MVSLTGQYRIRSNRESGYGRYDIMLIPVKETGKGIVIEFKKVEEDEGETLEVACDAALKQIKEKNYRQELEASEVADILEIGISFRGKEVMVKS
jgi:hypothetical protein